MSKWVMENPTKSDTVKPKSNSRCAECSYVSRGVCKHIIAVVRLGVQEVVAEVAMAAAITTDDSLHTEMLENHSERGGLINAIHSVYNVALQH